MLSSEDHLVGWLEDVLSLGGEGWELSDGTISVGGETRVKSSRLGEMEIILVCLE